ncbi:EcsC family protein [Aeromicrobium massiliense]|uniref:EcsC family protein n=1 Tax=Aeromicrobium massiliense TaxID=1464554 RepID=UPI0002F283F1|nr:EcsC family protein [Aeromicrobium massiliense]
MGIGRNAALAATAKAGPGFTSTYVRQVLEYAIDGLGPLRGAEDAADAALVSADGDVERAVKSYISSHVRMAAAQGFVTNLFGGTAAAVSIPANVAGVALVQCHLVAGIAHLRGYDLADPRVRNAALACMLGREGVQQLLKHKKLPSSPMALATSPVHDPQLDKRVATEVTTQIFGNVLGKRAAVFVARRVPVLGGGVGATSDAYSTREIGRYAAGELKDRRLRR